MPPSLEMSLGHFKHPPQAKKLSNVSSRVKWCQLTLNPYPYDNSSLSLLPDFTGSAICGWTYNSTPEPCWAVLLCLLELVKLSLERLVNSVPFSQVPIFPCPTLKPRIKQSCCFTKLWLKIIPWACHWSPIWVDKQLFLSPWGWGGGNHTLAAQIVLFGSGIYQVHLGEPCWAEFLWQ